MQTMVIEFARNVCGLAQRQLHRVRSGHARPRDLQAARAEGRRRAGRHHAPGRLSLPAGRRQLRARRPTARAEISERHRHRYEFNREYEAILKEHGLRLTGETPDGVYVEICELPDHPWYLGCQFHPEFKSKPLEPHPLFRAFIGAALEHRKRRPEAGITRPAKSRTRAAPRTSDFRSCDIAVTSASSDRRTAPLALIAGPCVIESEEHVHFLAREIRKIAGAFVFKASFDKANRSSVELLSRPGTEGGLAHFEERPRCAASPC